MGSLVLMSFTSRGLPVHGFWTALPEAGERLAGSAEGLMGADAAWMLLVLLGAARSDTPMELMEAVAEVSPEAGASSACEGVV